MSLGLGALHVGLQEYAFMNCMCMFVQLWECVHVCVRVGSVCICARGHLKV
jgi:hypothetical protein